MTATHTTLTTGDHIHGTTPSGRIIRTGTYKGFELRTSQTTPTSRDYEAIVRWDGDNYDSLVSFDRLTPATEPPAPTRADTIRAAALATRAWQADPTTDAFTTMLTTVDRATAAGATHDDIIAALALSAA